MSTRTLQLEGLKSYLFRCEQSEIKPSLNYLNRMKREIEFAKKQCYEEAWAGQHNSYLNRINTILNLYNI